MRSQARRKKQKRSDGKEGINFAISLITMTVVFVFVGYLLGQYAVKLLQSQHNAQVRMVQTTPAASSRSSVQPQSTTAPAASVPVSSEPAAVASQSTPSQTTATHDSSTSESGSRGTLYRVQVGAFSSRENADRLAARLRELGYDAAISSGPPYRVQTGAFASRDNAVRLSEELRAAGFEAVVVN